jgi:hypothetical protein
MAPQTLRGLLNLPERVAYRFVFEKLAEEDRLVAALPGDDITNHPGNVYAGNPFMNRNPLMVLRMLRSGKLDAHPRLKKYAEQWVNLVANDG